MQDLSQYNNEVLLILFHEMCLVLGRKRNKPDELLEAEIERYRMEILRRMEA